jgi:hypothetical protein
MLVVVSVGIVVVVSMPVPDGCVVTVSDDIGGDDVSVPVELSGVSQPIVAIAKKAMKRMLFMSFTLVFENDFHAYLSKKHSSLSKAAPYLI